MFPVLVPNLKGLDAAIASCATEVAVFGSASEGFSQKNINCSIEESLSRFEQVCDVALSKGIRVRGFTIPSLARTNFRYISCVIACPYDGPTPPENVLKVALAMLDMGCYEISLGDTIGVGTPDQVEKLLNVLLPQIPASQLAGHFHDTYGQAVANAVRAYTMGIRVFDSSVGGLGGCPYAKGAKGNVATEDLVYWHAILSSLLTSSFHGMGVQTGVDLDKLVDIGEWISQTLHRRNESRAGTAIYAKRTPTKETNQNASSTTVTATPASSDTLIVSRNQSTSTITLNNPSKGNVLTGPMIERLRSTISSLSSDPTIQVIILTNTGKYFCTGMDLSASGPATTGTTKAQLKNLLSTFESVNKCPKMTIALIKGSCFGGGVGLAFCCDIRIVVGSDKKFTLSEVKRGLVPATISKYVVREWGPALAREAMITGRPISATELFQKHIIHELIETEEEAQKKVDQYTALLKSSAPRAVSQVKDLVNAVAERKAEAEQIERIFIDMMRPSDEAKHGIEEFRKGNREVDWAAWYREHSGIRGKSKL